MCALQFINLAALDRLLELTEANAARLVELKTVRWSVPTDVMFACFRGFDGESDEFELHTLEGIERCTALESVEFEHLATAVELAPLKKLPALKRFSVIGLVQPGQVWTRLLEIASLERVDAPVDAETAAALSSRGVVVSPRR